MSLTRNLRAKPCTGTEFLGLSLLTLFYLGSTYEALHSVSRGSSNRQQSQVGRNRWEVLAVGGRSYKVAGSRYGR